MSTALPESVVAGAVTNAMSVDVEDYFQVSAFEKHIDRADWERLPCRVEANVDRILALFARHQVKATFFTLGWIATRHPDMVRKIAAQGHEIASHGWNHTRVTEQGRAEFREDVRRTREVLQQLSGQPVQGYRAASYSINGSNTWAWEELAAAGYRYSSSVVPVHHDLYGMPEAPRFAFRTADERLLEIPVSTVALAGRNLNCGGGGWFRLYPYWFSRWALRRLNGVEHAPGIFYFHPWEIDPDQPRVGGVEAKTRFRHYLNLHRMQTRIERLLSDFSWNRIDRVFELDKGSQ
jgi:polysaccharide deacetylase family protein (PEP-CTERM system associated)